MKINPPTPMQAAVIGIATATVITQPVRASVTAGLAGLGVWLIGWALGRVCDRLNARYPL